MRPLIIGGGIGGLAAAVALQRVGLEPVVFEKAREITEIGAGLTLWSNATLAARRLGVESDIVAAGSLIDETRSTLSSGEPIDELDVAALSRKAAAPTVCVHRADLQRILLEAALARDPRAVRTARECIGYEGDEEKVTALFADGSRERGDVLIGADGIHSIVRQSLFGSEAPRYAGYLTWRGIAQGVQHLLPKRQAVFVMGQGAQAGYFHCGGDRIYWFLTRNGPPHSQPGPAGNRAEVAALVDGWGVPMRQLVEATNESSILRNDIVDRAPRQVWGKGRLTLLGDAVHAATPNLGQGACQALEDAVILAHSLRGVAAEVGLRNYEARRGERANFVTEQSRQLGQLFQLSNPVAVWLRNILARTEWAKRQNQKLFERLLMVDLPELSGDATN